jgi:hypothetical protein
MGVVPLVTQAFAMQTSGLLQSRLLWHVSPSPLPPVALLLLEEQPVTDSATAKPVMTQEIQDILIFKLRIVGIGFEAGPIRSSSRMGGAPAGRLEKSL